MIHHTIGNIGHLCIIVAFITAFAAAFAYLKATQSIDLQQQTGWKRYARVAFAIHGVAVMGIMTSLFFIIYNHYYEYHYAWNYSSNSLPTHFVIATFWNGQEGGFLLWIFWHVFLGLALILTNKTWEMPVMAIFAMVQAFLCSMVLGIVFFDTLKIGSSPFILLKDAMPALPVWQTKPDWIPEDGRGLNPTLQNYWMVIHPPTLFLGFASTTVPFVFVLVALWQKRVADFVKTVLPWALFSVCILGIGIMM
ncbi:MAG: cytochrome C biogenesis protein, partial [Verrucomicrobia bacterium]|nr:cytochrome C biogenesis protein [Cytophagales bacterium]